MGYTDVYRTQTVLTRCSDALDPRRARALAEEGFCFAIDMRRAGEIVDRIDTPPADSRPATERRAQMTIEFERTKQTVCGRSVMITSWFDDEENTWRSSAPTYGFISTALSDDSSKHSSRRSAIDRTVALLNNRFRLDDGGRPAE